MTNAFEREAAASASAPDPARIAAIANSLFQGLPVEPPPGPGASLPAVPVFAAEPLMAAIPGAPQSAPPVSPNLTPGISGVPMPGASMPSAPVQSYEPLSSAEPGPATAASLQPSGEKGASGQLPVSTAPLPTPGVPGFLSEADLASLPSTLGGAMSVIPPLGDPGFPSGGPGASFGSAPAQLGAPIAAAAPGVTGASPLASPGAPSFPAPGAGIPSAPVFAFEPLNYAVSPTAAAFGQPLGGKDAGPAPDPNLSGGSYYFLDEGLSASSRANPLPYGTNGQALNLGLLPAEHVPTIALPPISGARQFDAHIFRRDFPILQEYVNGRPLIWLDNAATTQKPQAVIDRISHFYAHENSNVHRAAHALAARSTDAFEAAREKVRRFINAPSDKSIVWVRGTTEAVNLVAQAWGRRNVGEGDEVVISNLEHHSNIVPWQMLCAEVGAILRVAPVDDRGDILLDEYKRLLNPRTKIVAFTQVSNALGTVTPVRDMVEMAHRHGARVLVDGAQAVCHMPVDVQALDVDFYVFSGHKVFGPTGVGALYGKPKELETMPPWQGGGSMIKDVTFEKSVYQDPPEKFEAGTGTIADAVGLGAAIDYVEQIGMANIAAYEHLLLDYALEGLGTVPGLSFVGMPRERAGAISFVLDQWRVEDVGKALNQEGIAVRAGHHCAQPILRRFGHEATVRPSFALYNTPEDVDALVAALHRIASDRGRHGF